MNGTLRITEPWNDGTGFFFDAGRRLGEWRTRFHHLELYDTLCYGRLLRVDERNASAERQAFVRHENLIHPALTAHAAPRQVLIVGGGDGGAAAEALRHPTVDALTLCERDGELLAVAREHLGAVHRGAFDDPRLCVVADDGAAFVARTHGRFDLIALDAQHLREPLDSVAFLQHCRQALAPTGALALGLGAPEARPERVAAIAQRLNAVFRIVRPYTVYLPLHGAQWAFAVCSDKLDPKSYTADEIDRRIDARRLAGLRCYNGETHEGVFALPNFLRDLVVPPRVKTHSRGRRLGVVQALAK